MVLCDVVIHVQRMSYVDIWFKIHFLLSDEALVEFKAAPWKDFANEVSLKVQNIEQIWLVETKFKLHRDGWSQTHRGEPWQGEEGLNPHIEDTYQSPILGEEYLAQRTVRQWRVDETATYGVTRAICSHLSEFTAPMYKAAVPVVSK